VSYTELHREQPLDVLPGGEYPAGSGRAIAVIDYGPSDNLLWVVAMDATGECWTVPNKAVRFTKNISLGRRVKR